MKITHVISQDYSITNGIKTVLSNLIPEQEKLGHEVTVFNVRINLSHIFNNDIYISGYKDFCGRVNNIVPDVIVFHGSYELKYFYFALYLRKKNIPYLIVPHGGTSRYNLSKKRFLKIIVNSFLTRPFIGKSNGVIFLNAQERENSIFKHLIRDFAIIPNGVHIPCALYSHQLHSNKVRFMFLSRIDIKYKGLDLLLQSIEQVANNYRDLNCEFHFYGSRYDRTIVEEFIHLIKNNRGPVFYHGEVLGKEKEEAYINSNIYVLPSLSEGMPLTVLEALSYGLPCIVTPQTNMSELIEKHKAGWVTKTNVQSITNTLVMAYNDYVTNRETYIKNAIDAVVPYDWSNIATQCIQEYSRLISN